MKSDASKHRAPALCAAAAAVIESLEARQLFCGAHDRAALSLDRLEASLPEVTIEATDRIASEDGPDTGTYRISRTGDLSAPLVVNFVVGGRATNGVDYGIVGNAITIAAGASSFAFLVTPVSDAKVEPMESITLTLADTGAYAINPAAPAATLLLNDGGAAPAEIGFSTINVNFQPYDVPVPDWHVVDGGATFARRPNGLTYGWNTDRTAGARDRDSANAPDQRYDTLNHLGTGDWWAMAVPNAAYQVRVVAGDPSNIDSVYRINVEGVLSVDGTPTSNRRFFQETRIVRVTDGAVTLASASGAVNNKLLFVEITRLPEAAAPPLAPSAMSAKATSSSSAKLTWQDHSDNEAGFKIERKTGSNGAWKEIDVVPANATSYTDTGLAQLTHYVYRVRAYNAAGNSAFTTDDTTTPQYFPRDISWKTVAPSPVARAESLGGVINDKLYVFGGLYTDDGEILATQRSDVYDPATNKWTRIADMPERITHAGTVIVGDTFWIVGGYFGHHPGPGGDHVWKYNTTTNKWSRGPDLPDNRGAGSAVRIGNRIHFVAGLDETRGDDLNDHWALDLGNQSAGWVRREDLPSARNHTSAVSLNGYMYVIGGQKDEEELQEPLRSVYRYDPGDDDWDRVKDLPFPRSHTNSSTFVMNGRIIVLGGEDGFNEVRRTIYAYDPKADKWEAMSDLPAARSTSVAGVLSGNRIISATGNSPVPTTATWIGTVS